MPETRATCRSCGVMLPENARFCPECGAPIAPAGRREVRKTVTLLFTDVTGSTALGEQLDPEAYRDVMGRFFLASREAIERHGGTVEKFVGDAVLAVFGVPEVREDDAVRAVRAAHDLNRAVRALSDELSTGLGVRLEIRTGVNTGSVVAGSARAGGSFATGDAVNVAARLEQAAAPGEILLGHSTWELVRDAVRVEETPPVTAKGKTEPLRAFRLLGVDVESTGRRRRTDVALIGRDREIHVLDDALDRTLETGRTHLVTITGAPGLGKTRLVSDFVDGVGHRAEVLRGRCVAYGQGITYWPVVQVLREAGGLQGEESADVTREALLRRLTGGGDDATDHEVVQQLLPLLGKGGDPGGQEQIFWAVGWFVGQLAIRRPLVITLDDLHWAEPTLLELLDRVRDETRDLPVLMVCGARPELLDEQPGWGRGSSNSITLGLEPFDEELTAASLASLLGAGVPTPVARAVANWSGGNPLFVEEIAAHLVETGVLRPNEGGWELAGDLAHAGVPPTVSALLAGRLDRLPPAEGDLLERVSVLGEQFTAAEADVLAGGDVAGATTGAVLANLARRDLLRRVRAGQDDSWAFAHVIVRDAAYETLPKSLRGELHLKVAEYLSQHEGRAGGEHLAFVAHHLAQASRYADLLAPHDAATRALAERATTAVMDAADAARLREDNRGAAALLRTALDLRPGARARRELLVRLQQVVDPQDDNDGRGRASDLYELTLDDQDEPAAELDRAHTALHKLNTRLMVSEDVDPAAMVPLAERVIELATAAGQTRHRLLALDCLLTVHGFAGQWKSVGELLDVMSEVGDQQDRREAEQYRGFAYLVGPFPLTRLGEYAASLQATARSPQERAFAPLAGAMSRVGRGDPGSAGQLEEALAALAEFDTGNDILWPHMRVSAKLLAGDLQGARASLALMVDFLRSAGDFSHGSGYLSWLALLDLELGADPARVAPMLDEADRWTSPYDVMAAGLLAAARAVLSARTGDLDTAAELARTSVEVIDRGEGGWFRADVRRWVSEVPRAQSEVEDERRLLTEALEIYVAKEIVTWNEQIGARLAELGGD